VPLTLSTSHAGWPSNKALHLTVRFAALQLALDEQAHRHRRGMPAARRQALEHRPSGGLFVEVKRLGIEFRGE
jgi:hypothetical protein